MKLLKWLVKKETKIDKTNAVKSDNMTDVWAEADKWIPHGGSAGRWNEYNDGDPKWKSQSKTY